MVPGKQKPASKSQDLLDGCIAFLSMNRGFFSWCRWRALWLPAGRGTFPNTRETRLELSIRSACSTVVPVSSLFAGSQCEDVLELSSGTQLWSLGFQTTWRQWGLMQKCWASCLETWLLSPLLYSLETVRLYYVSTLLSSPLHPCHGSWGWSILPVLLALDLAR